MEILLFLRFCDAKGKYLYIVFLQLSGENIVDHSFSADSALKGQTLLIARGGW